MLRCRNCKYEKEPEAFTRWQREQPAPLCCDCFLKVDEQLLASHVAILAKEAAIRNEFHKKMGIR